MFVKTYCIFLFPTPSSPKPLKSPEINPPSLPGARIQQRTLQNGDLAFKQRQEDALDLFVLGLVLGICMGLKRYFVGFRWLLVEVF